MNKIKLKRIFFINFLTLILLSYFSFGTCDYHPDDIKIYSGNYYLGEFNSGDNVYILPNLGENDLKIEYYFENLEENCFNSDKDMSMKLIPSGSDVFASSLKNEKDNETSIDIFTFVFNPKITLTSSFTSTFKIIPSSTSGNFNFASDEENPTINYLTYSPIVKLIKKNEEININYKVSDLKSGLSKILIGSKTILFENNNKTFEGSIKENLSSDKTFILDVYDKFNHNTKKEISFKVDSSSPVLTSLSKSYSYNGERKISFSIKITDDSFSYYNDAPIITGDFSEINSDYNKKTPTSCTKTSEKEYECQWSNLIIQKDSTFNANLKFNVSDKLENNKIYSFTEEVFVDKKGPTIESFSLINDIGIPNLFSAYGNNSYIYLKFKDESLTFGNYRIIPSFDKLDFLTSECNQKGVNEMECFWKVGNAIEIYKGLKYSNITLSVEVIDYYGNPSTSSVKVNIDNVLPKAKEIELVETNSITDEIVQSGEKINFKILFSDRNAASNDGKYFVFGLFNTIDFRSEMQNLTQGECSAYNTTYTECEFKDIIVSNGYLKKNISIVVFDAAGNAIVKTKEVEILKVSDEEIKAFVDGKTYEIINPINRNAILSASTTNAWFEGNLEFVDGINPSMKIINYGIKPGSCNESNLEPLLIIKNSLYPNDIKIGIGKNEEDTEFVIKTTLKNHENFNDLNDKTMSCIFSVLKRDDTTIYSPEEVKINLKYTFYDIPRGTILNAHAEKVIELIDDAEFLGSWFDKTYKIYNMFDRICNVVGGATGIISTISGIWNYITVVLENIPWTQKAAEAMNKVIGTGDGSLSKLYSDITSPVKKICDYVTCRNGGTLLGLMTDGKGPKDIPGLKQIYNLQKKTTELVCINPSTAKFGN